MVKKPRMPKSAPPPKDEHDDDVVITDAPAPVTSINKPSAAKTPAERAAGKKDKPAATKETSSKPGKRRAADPAPDDEDVQPAPRSKMREKLLRTAQQTDKKPKNRNTKRIDDDIWDRQDRAASFEDDPEPARQFSGRTVALLAVLFIAALIMAQPLQMLLEQQSDITHAQQQLAGENERQEELETQLQRWEDPAYVEQQARERFNMVMPGERKYMVIDEDDENTLAPEPGVAALDEHVEMGWADRLWGSVLSSGQE